MAIYSGETCEILVIYLISVFCVIANLQDDEEYQVRKPKTRARKVSAKKPANNKKKRK